MPNPKLKNHCVPGYMQYNLVLRFFECLNLMVACHLAAGLFVTSGYKNAYFALGTGTDPANLPAVNYPFKMILTAMGIDPIKQRFKIRQNA